MKIIHSIFKIDRVHKKLRKVVNTPPHTSSIGGTKHLTQAGKRISDVMPRIEFKIDLLKQKFEAEAV